MIYIKKKLIVFFSLIIYILRENILKAIPLSILIIREMVKATTLEILANFRAVMAELQTIRSRIITGKHIQARKWKSKTFPYFTQDNYEQPCRNFSLILRVGEYYDESNCCSNLQIKLHNKYKNTKDYIALPECDIKTLQDQQNRRIQRLGWITDLITKHEPELLEYYNLYLHRTYLSYVKWSMKDGKEIKSEEDWTAEVKEKKQDCSWGFEWFLMRDCEFYSKEIATNPYLTKKKRNEGYTYMHLACFHSYLFNSKRNFSLFRVKYGKGDKKITNKGCKSGWYSTYKYSSSNDRDNENISILSSHYNLEELKEICKMNNIAVEKGKTKYEDLAALLKEKMP